MMTTSAVDLTLAPTEATKAATNTAGDAVAALVAAVGAREPTALAAAVPRAAAARPTPQVANDLLSFASSQRL